jgi:hypothetical protein
VADSSRGCGRNGGIVIKFSIANKMCPGNVRVRNVNGRENFSLSRAENIFF